MVRRLALRRRAVSPGGSDAHRRARAARRGSWCPGLRTGEVRGARPMPASSARTRARGSSRPAVGRTSPCRSRTPRRRRRPEPSRPGGAAFSSPISPNDSPRSIVRSTCTSPVSGSSSSTANCPCARRRRRRPVALAEDGLTRADTPERTRPARSFRRLDRQIVERGQRVDRARQPRRATSFRHGTRVRERCARTRRMSARTSCDQTADRGPAPGTRRAARAGSCEPRPPFQSDDTRPPKIRFQKKYAV